ncbi:hypothetical protein [Paraoerskovia marina]|uniref:hypothetical protein n=1 Tax=Paraoerskovia marina TaxID=545619 RepID=UPI0012DC4AB6|nr:hypothetical protein [Paraoerskovia marina]
MSAMTEKVEEEGNEEEESAWVSSSAPGDLRVALPATWWVVPLTDSAARSRSVRALVERQVGRADVQVSLRHELRRELSATLDAAHREGGRLFATSLMEVAGRPVSATVTTFRLGPERTLDGQRRRVRMLGGEASEAIGPYGTVLRQVRESNGPDVWGCTDLRQLVVDYWFDPDDGEGLFRATFTTPHLPLRDAMTELFDTIVAGIG